MAKQSQGEARQPVVRESDDSADARATVTIPAKETHAGFVASLARLSLEASRSGQHPQHAVLHDLEVRAGSLLTHAIAAQSQLEGDAADIVRELCRSL